MTHDHDVISHDERDSTANAETVSERERAVVAERLHDGADAVVWGEGWLMDQKPLTTVGGWYRLAAVNGFEEYSENSYAVHDPETGDRVYLPKSCTVVFTLDGGANTTDEFAAVVGGEAA